MPFGALTKFAFSFSLLLLSCPTMWANSLLNIPLDDPLVTEVYEFIDRVVLKYRLKGFVKNQRPYTHGEVSKILDQLRLTNFPLTQVERKRLERLAQYFSKERTTLLGTKGNDYRFDLNLELGQITTHRTDPANTSGTEYAWQVRPIVDGSIRDDFAFSTDLRWHLIHGTVLPGTVRVEAEIEGGFLSAGLVPAYAKFKMPWFELLIGKDNVSWGPGRRGNLLVSANPLPMDMIQIQAQYGKIGFNAFTASVKSLLDRNKILAGHRLDFNLWDWGNLGIAESMVIAENDFELRFLNPFTIYAVTTASGAGLFDETVETSRANLLISGDLELRIFRNLALYGELMIDDFQTLYGLSSYRNWGTKFGIQLGIQLIDPLSIDNSDLRIEYTFINQFAYTHMQAANAFTHFERLIGHEIGSDADNLWLNFNYWLTDVLSSTITYEIEQHGEGNVNIPHITTLETLKDRWEFLSGITESTHALSLGIKYHAIGEFLLGSRYQFSHIVNFNHQTGNSANGHDVTLSALYRF